MEQEQRKKPEINTHSTYGDVVTKDTLSYTEKKELLVKKENGTLTDDDRKKLLYDDSRLSIRSTTGILKEDRVTYNPNVEYFMMDYHHKPECRWIRMGYMTQTELLDRLKYMVENYNDYSGFRIHSERELDMKLEVKCVDGEYRELTLRNILFDGRYDDYSDLNKDPKSDFMKNGYESLNSETLLDERKEKIVDKLLRNEELDLMDDDDWEVLQLNDSF